MKHEFPEWLPDNIVQALLTIVAAHTLAKYEIAEKNYNHEFGFQRDKSSDEEWQVLVEKHQKYVDEYHDVSIVADPKNSSVNIHHRGSKIAIVNLLGDVYIACNGEKRSERGELVGNLITENPLNLFGTLKCHLVVAKNYRKYAQFNTFGEL